jgi:hypothetical protein
MKLITHLYMPLLAMLVIFFSCADDERTQKSQVQFGVNLIGNDHQILTSIPDEGYFIISITNSVGVPVISDEKINVVAGEQFITVPLTLPPGKYRLMQLSFVDKNSDLIRYAVPEPTLLLGKDVTDAFHSDFTIGNGEKQTLQFDLLDVSKYKPGNFGLTSFKVSRNNLKLVVHADGVKKPVSAEAFILQGIDTVDHYVLEAKMNQLVLHGDPGQPYTVLVTKSGYMTYEKQLTIGELKGGKPLVATLEQGSVFSMLGYVDDQNFNFEFSFELIFTGTINVDWGDNSADTTLVFTTPTQARLPHSYPAAGNYPITVTGDIDQITMFYSYYGQGQIDAVDFAPLVNLTEIRFGLTRSPQIIDLTHNTKLEFAALAGLDAVEILLPAQHNISTISISGPNGLTPEAVDAVISNIYANSVTKNITHGIFDLVAHWYEPEGANIMVGPPSADAVEKLRILQNDYGWIISPEVPQSE